MNGMIPCLLALLGLALLGGEHQLAAAGGGQQQLASSRPGEEAAAAAAGIVCHVGSPCAARYSGFGRQGCCPYENAVCCPNQQTCCPAGTT